MAFWRTFYHLVWSTKNRYPTITAELEEKLFPYLVAKAYAAEVNVHAINGCEDHLHLVVSIPPKLSISDVVRLLKGASSHYVTNTLQWEEDFGWQRGFGVFTLGETQLEKAVDYVERQKEHHGAGTTNDWLEKIAESDESIYKSQPIYGKIRESEANGYGLMENDQFP